MANIEEDVYKIILEKLKDITYGTVLITIHNDAITQLDVTKKHRFDKVQAKQATPKLVK